MGIKEEVEKYATQSERTNQKDTGKGFQGYGKS